MLGSSFNVTSRVKSMSVGCNCLSGLRHCAEKNRGAGKWMHGQNLTQLWVSLWTQLTGELKEQWVQKFLRATSCQLQRFHKDYCTKFHENHTANQTTYVILVSSHATQCMELFFTVWNGGPLDHFSAWILFHCFCVFYFILLAVAFVLYPISRSRSNWLKCWGNLIMHTTILFLFSFVPWSQTYCKCIIKMFG